MRSWLSWAWPAASLAAIVAACGGGNGTNNGGFTTDGGENGDGASSSSSGASGSGSGAGSSGSGSSSGGSTSSSGGSSSGPSDATLDIAFPDVFTTPDSSSGSGGSTSSSGGDASMPCSPNGITCTGNLENDCNNGTLSTYDCMHLIPPQQCVNGYGCVVCVPGTGTCNGNTGSACNSTGSGRVINNCDPALGETCNPSTGQCEGDCANVGSSYIGCEYYAVTMSNTELDQSTFFYSVSISNTTNKSAQIVITGPSYNQTFTLAAGAIQNYQLPWVSSISCQGGKPCNGTAFETPSTTLIAGGAYHIKSTEPVTVYEFNAYDYQLNVSCGSDPNGSPPCHSYTNDASLLIPVNAMTGNYRVVSGATWGFNNNGTSIEVPGVVAIVGTAAGTQVTFHMAQGTITPGAGLLVTGGTATLNAGDVLQITTALDAPEPGFGSDPSGALVTATAPVEVIGGSDCSFMPANNWACDHLEQINFPLETLASDYVVAAPFNNNGGPKQFVKIVGTAAGTALTTTPLQAGVPNSIGAGQVVFFESTSDFHLVSSKPVIVGQFMEGQYQFGNGCPNGGLTGPPDCGDPSMSLAVATAQFRQSYQFIAPPSYYENWVNVIAPMGATVTLDGTNVAGFGGAIGNSNYSVAHVSLCANGSCNGVHSIQSSQPFGIEVYGYGYFTSYMYPGGLNLNRQ